MSQLDTRFLIQAERNEEAFKRIQKKMMCAKSTLGYFLLQDVVIFLTFVWKILFNLCILSVATHIPLTFDAVNVKLNVIIRKIKFCHFFSISTN